MGKAIELIAFGQQGKRSYFETRLKETKLSHCLFWCFIGKYLFIYIFIVMDDVNQILPPSPAQASIYTHELSDGDNDSASHA